MSNFIIMSDEKQDINKAIEDIGFTIIKSDNNEILPEFERRHADLQCLKINHTLFVLKECENLLNKLKQTAYEVIVTDKSIEQKYPANVGLNAVYMNKKLYCKADALFNAVKEYCKANDIEIINVKQGYTKCSTAVFGNCFITADKGIFRAMTKNGEEGLLIDSGCIELDGVDYGFIGGSSFYHNKTAYFTGNIKKHKSYELIKKFLSERNIDVVSLTQNNIYDIGGFVLL